MTCRSISLSCLLWWHERLVVRSSISFKPTAALLHFFFFFNKSLSLSTLALARFSPSPISLLSSPAGHVIGGKPRFLSPLFMASLSACSSWMVEHKNGFLRSFLDDFRDNFYGVLMGRVWGTWWKLKIDFWTSFDRRVFWSETLNVDLESLARFLNEPRLDLSSLGWL